MGRLEVAQCIHLRLQIRERQAINLASQLFLEALAIRRRVEAGAVEQLIEQNGLCRQQFGNPGTRLTQGDQLSQCRRILHQQHEVGAAPKHGTHQWENTLQRQVGLADAGTGLKQQRHELLQALPAFPLQTPQACDIPQVRQSVQGILGLGVAQLAQDTGVERIPRRQRRFGFGVFRRGNEIVEVSGHSLPVARQSDIEVIPIRETHDLGQRRTPQRISRKLLGLSIGVTLYRVLGITQKTVGLPQLLADIGGQAAQFGAAWQHIQQLSLLQRPVPTAAYQLQALGNEFDLADTSGAELDVVIESPARHLRHKHALHPAQTVDHAKVDIAPEHEGAQHAHEPGAIGCTAGDRPRLDQRIALPVATLVLVVLLQRSKIVDQGTALPVGTQAHIHPEHKAISGHRVQGVDHRTPQPGEKLFVTQGLALTVRLPRLAKRKYQVDIRRYIEFARAQLAHGDHDKRLPLTGTPADRSAKALYQLRFAHREGVMHAGLGEQGGVAYGLQGIGEAVEVTPENTQHVILAELAQGHRKIG